MQDHVQLFGVLAILGSIGVSVGDMFLLGNPVSGRVFRERRLENLLHVSPQNMRIGHTLGVLALPLILFGIIQMYYAVQTVAPVYAVSLAMIMTFMLVVGAAAHACFAFLGGALQLQRDLGETAEPELQTLVQQHERLLYPLFLPFLVALVVGSLEFAFVVWTQDTLYPRWVALTNPLGLFILFGTVANFLPAPLGGYIRPANGNISFAAFFAISTIALTR